MHMKVIYIAGPFRALTPWKVEENIRMAERTALRVAKAGHVPLCPHTMYRFFDDSTSDEFWLKGTQELLRRCDAIVMSAGWQESEGSKDERVLAGDLKMRIFAYIQDFEVAVGEGWGS